MYFIRRGFEDHFKGQIEGKEADGLCRFLRCGVWAALSPLDERIGGPPWTAPSGNFDACLRGGGRESGLGWGQGGVFMA